MLCYEITILKINEICTRPTYQIKASYQCSELLYHSTPFSVITLHGSSENPMILAYSNSCSQKHHGINYLDTTVAPVHLQTQSNTQFRACGSINQLKETLYRQTCPGHAVTYSEPPTTTCPQRLITYANTHIYTHYM